MLKITLAAAALCFSLLAGCEHPPSNACLSGRRDALVAGGFSGPIVCSAEDASFVRVGKTGGYTLYDYRYRFMPEHGAVMHGGQRLLVFRGAQYAGQYALSAPPYAHVRMKGSRALFQSDGSPEVSVIDFSNGPPPRLFASGHFSSFFR